MATGLLAGCAAPTQRLIETHYGLSPKLEAVDLSGRVMVVGRVNASGIFAGRPLIRRRGTAPLNYEETAANSGIRHPPICYRTALSAAGMPPAHSMLQPPEMSLPTG